MRKRQKIQKVSREIIMEVPKFKPRPGQTDYTNIRWSPVINCVLINEGKILVVQRNEKLNFYPGYWNGVSGFLDDQRSLIEKVKDELCEELGIPAEGIVSIQLGDIFDQEEEKYCKTWIVHPVLVEVKNRDIKLDWEAKNYKWATFNEIKTMKLLPGFEEVLKRLFKWIRK